MKNNEADYFYTKEVPEDYTPRMVGVDPDLQALERETILVFNDGEDTAAVSSSQVVVIRYLLAHPNFKLGEIAWKAQKIVGVSGSLPKNCCLLTLQPRKEFHSGFKRRAVRKKGL